MNPAAEAATIPLRGPYDVARSIAFWGRSTGELCEHWAEGLYRRVVELGGVPAVMSLRSSGSVEAPAVIVELDGRLAQPAELEALGPFVRHLLGDDLDLRAFYAAVAGDQTLAPVIQRLYGLRAPRSPLWETLCVVVIGQQISVPFAYLLKQRLIQRYGQRYEAGGRPLYSFPAPAVLAAADPAELTGMQFSRNKAGFVIGLAQSVMQGVLDLQALAALPTAEAISYLTQFRGIGAWTAEFTLMRGLGRPDALPANDAGVRQGIMALYGVRLAERELRSFGERWDGWGGIVALYLLAWLRAEAERKRQSS